MQRSQITRQCAATQTSLSPSPREEIPNSPQQTKASTTTKRERERDGCGRLVQLPRVLTIHNAARQHLGMWNLATSRDFVHSQYNTMGIWGCRNFFLSTFFSQFSFSFFLFLFSFLVFFSLGGVGGLLLLAKLNLCFK